MTTREEAASRAEQIRLGLQQTGVLYAKAVEEHDWQTLGYSSVAQWARCEFGPDRFSAERRKEIVAFLTDAGLTQRQIAAATGASQATVMRDQRTREPDESPGPNVPAEPTEGTAQTPDGGSAQTPNGRTRQQAAREREARRRAPAHVPNGSNAQNGDGRSRAAAAERARLIAAICDQVTTAIKAIFADTEGENLITQLEYLEDNRELISDHHKRQLVAALTHIAVTATQHRDRISSAATPQPAAPAATATRRASRGYCGTTLTDRTPCILPRGHAGDHENTDRVSLEPIAS